MQTAILDVNIGLGDLLIELTGGKEIHKTGSEKANTQPPPSVQCRHLGILSGLGARPARTRDENYVYFIYSNLYPYPAPNTAPLDLVFLYSNASVDLPFVDIVYLPWSSLAGRSEKKEVGSGAAWSPRENERLFFAAGTGPGHVLPRKSP